MENRIVAYIKVRQERYKQDKCGLSWSYLRAKAMKYAETEEDKELYKTFLASDGWLNKLMHRQKLKSFKLHGETNEMSEEKRTEIMTKS